MISKYLVAAVVVLCLAGLLESQGTPPNFKQEKLVPSNAVCPWSWRRVCPNFVISNRRGYRVAKVNGTTQCYDYKRCRIPNDCCGLKRRCQQDLNRHQFIVNSSNRLISVWVNVPTTCYCLPFPRSGGGTDGL